MEFENFLSQTIIYITYSFSFKNLAELISQILFTKVYYQFFLLPDLLYSWATNRAAAKYISLKTGKRVIVYKLCSKESFSISMAFIDVFLLIFFLLDAKNNTKILK